DGDGLGSGGLLLDLAVAVAGGAGGVLDLDRELGQVLGDEVGRRGFHRGDHTVEAQQRGDFEADVESAVGGVGLRGAVGVVALADAFTYRVDDLAGVAVDVLDVGLDQPGGGLSTLPGGGDALTADGSSAQV